MEPNTNMSTAGIICCGIMKLLWYLFLVTAGILIFITMVIWEAATAKNSNSC
jgi:hypothetical protein